MNPTWVFDLDGTLVDSFAKYFEAMREIFAARGTVFREEHQLPALTEPLPEFFAAHLGAMQMASAFAELQERSNDDATRIRPFAGMPEILEALKARGNRIAIWTNRDLVSAELILKHSGLGQYVDYCVSGTCVERRKPHPEGLSRILQRFSCPLAEVVVIGDHDHDMLAAKSAGARAIRASWHGYWAVEACSRAELQFHTVPEFAAWLDPSPKPVEGALRGTR